MYIYIVIFIPSMQHHDYHQHELHFHKTAFPRYFFFHSSHVPTVSEKSKKNVNNDIFQGFAQMKNHMQLDVQHNETILQKN